MKDLRSSRSAASRFVTGPDCLETFGGLSGRHRQKLALESGLAQGLPSRRAETRRDVPVRDDDATAAKADGGAFAAQASEETRADFDLVAAAAQRYIYGAHRLRIGAARVLSKPQ